jgi:hypothetical protein
MAGISSDHTEAATMTPEANPSKTFCSSIGISLFMKKTNPEPRAVPRNGINKEARTADMANAFGTPANIRDFGRNVYLRVART